MEPFVCPDLARDETQAAGMLTRESASPLLTEGRLCIVGSVTEETAWAEKEGDAPPSKLRPRKRAPTRPVGRT